jgi:hypothetical protein
MLDLKELRGKYVNQNWYNSVDEKILIKDIIEYTGIGLFKVIYERGFNQPTQYLSDISRYKLMDFLNDLKKYKMNDLVKVKNPKEKDLEKQNDLEKLKDILFVTINDVIDDSIALEKANTISKVAQTILNLEKINLSQKQNK